MACLANAPNAGSTWQRPQMPRPPHTESRSTPSSRAASSTVVPVRTAPRRPDGTKTATAVPAGWSVTIAARRARGAWSRRLRLAAGRHRIPTARGDQRPQPLRGERRVEPSRLRLRRGERIAGDRERSTAPLGDVLVGRLLAGHLRGPVDRLLEAVGEQHLVALLSGAGVDLGRDVAPGDDDHLGSVPGHEDQAR